LRVTLAADQIGSGPHPINRRVVEVGDAARRRGTDARYNDDDGDVVAVVITPREEDENDDGGAKP
jgi:hypothetical protein